MKINCPKACGECCRVIILTNHKDISLRKQWSGRKDKSARFYFKNFKRIARKQAIGINSMIGGVRPYKGISYFICKLYDCKNNECLGYKSWRPYMCTDYPFYENVVLDVNYFGHCPDCYYINQLMKVS